VHLRKRNRSPEDFDLDELAEVSEGYSGAEIEAAGSGRLVSALRSNCQNSKRW
jgi:SpoVK/Ycf46/Vps4 family AAA+-type ATPase